jgi:riboflavin synthase
MFTGLVEGIGKVKSLQGMGGDTRLTICPPFQVAECQRGESIAVDGVCLTVTEISGDAFSMDVSRETSSRSTLSLLKQGDSVNLERALRLNDRLGGHLVLGHVDGIGKVLKKERRGRSWLVRIRIDPGLSRYTIEKGSIAVDGISLTINRCEEDFFEVNIVTQTGGETTILTKRIGDSVNIETDLIGKYVEKLFVRKGPLSEKEMRKGIDMEMLLKHGYGE